MIGNGLDSLKMKGRVEHLKYGEWKLNETLIELGKSLMVGNIYV